MVSMPDATGDGEFEIDTSILRFDKKEVKKGRKVIGYVWASGEDAFFYQAIGQKPVSAQSLSEAYLSLAATRVL